MFNLLRRSKAYELGSISLSWVAKKKNDASETFAIQTVISCIFKYTY